MADHSTFERRVVVVDDDEWRRRGLVDAVRELGGVLRVHAALPHARVNDFDWDAVDIVVVVATGAHESWDQMSGVRSAELVRALDPSRRVVMVLVVDADVGPLIAPRAAEAGVDFVYPWSALTTMEELERAVLAPSADLVPTRIADLAAMRELGVSFSSRLNRGLAHIEREHLCHLFEPTSEVTVSRRQLITSRRRLTDIMRITPVRDRSGSMVDATLPSWRQLRQVVEIARIGRSTPR